MNKTAITLITFCLLALSCNVGDVAGWTGANKKKNSQTMANLINPPKLKECHAKGYLYDRSTESCHSARLMVYPCKAYQATNVFKPRAREVVFKFSVLLASGWKFDQCGILNRKPIATMYRENKDSSEPKLDLLTLTPQQ